MDLNYIRIAELVERYINKEISPEERDELDVWRQKYPQIGEWLESEGSKNTEVRERLDHYMSKNMLSDWDIIKAKANSRKKSKIGWLSAVAIAALLIVGIWQVRESENTSTSYAVDYAEQVVPAKEKAYLTLSNGDVVFLEGKETRTLQDKDVDVLIDNSSLDYSSVTSKEMLFHTLFVPTGGTYQIRLNDGTNVWLNSDSELTFPSVFAGDERIVYVKGEAFFEVAKDPLKTFIVEVDGTQIEALGTAFNVNSHLRNGMVKTILTEGKVKVSAGDNHSIIEEGYATISTTNEILVEKADLEEALAWKEGYFYFRNKDLNDILGEVSRWYDVKLNVEVLINRDTYDGGIKRSESIEKVCEVLEDLTGYQLVVVDRVLTIKNKEK